jgi:hypothetical protein
VAPDLESRELALLSLDWRMEENDLMLSDHKSSRTIRELLLSAEGEVALRQTLESASRQATERHGEGGRETPPALRAALIERN